MEALPILVLMFAPLALGLGALGASVLLFRRAKASSSPTLLRVLATFLLLAGLGIGSCYGVMWLS